MAAHAKAKDKVDLGKKIENRILKLASFLHIKPSIFTKYFLTFAAIFLTVMVALGVALILLVNNYTVNERTSMLKENVYSHCKHNRGHAFHQRNEREIYTWKRTAV